MHTSKTIRKKKRKGLSRRALKLPRELDKSHASESLTLACATVLLSWNVPAIINDKIAVYTFSGQIFNTSIFFWKFLEVQKDTSVKEWLRKFVCA